MTAQECHFINDSYLCYLNINHISSSRAVQKAGLLRVAPGQSPNGLGYYFLWFQNPQPVSLLGPPFNHFLETSCSYGIHERSIANKDMPSACLCSVYSHYTDFEIVDSIFFIYLIGVYDVFPLYGGGQI